MTAVNPTTDAIPPEPRASYWEADHALRRLLARRLPEATRAWAWPRLAEMGRVAAERVADLARTADRDPPRLLDDGRVGYCDAYREMERIAYGSGMIALRYDAEVRRAHGAHAQTVGFALGYLFAQAEAGLYCPVCMTDGVARVLERSGDERLAREWIPRLCFTRPEERTTGAMFLTERQGGSDVGANTVRAVEAEGGGWRLYGEKWFCSNADAEVALVLARPEGAPAGTRGLGLFLLPRDWDGAPQPGIAIRKLKDKLGVRSMPTGEIELAGARAWPVGPIDLGFKQMAEMVNYSRLYNAVAAAACMARVTLEARHWARERRAFGRPVAEHPLARATLESLATEHAAALHLVFEAVEATGRWDAGEEGARALVRGLTPLAKYHTAKAAVACASEAMEVVGGNGYIEDRSMARLLRDAQVLPIWEGTTNIQILDAVRALRVDGASEALAARLARALEGEEVTAALRDRLAPRVAEAARGLAERAASREPPGPDARTFFDRVTRTFEAALLAEAGEGDLAARVSPS